MNNWEAEQTPPRPTGMVSDLITKSSLLDDKTMKPIAIENIVEKEDTQRNEHIVIVDLLSLTATNSPTVVVY